MGRLTASHICSQCGFAEFFPRLLAASPYQSQVPLYVTTQKSLSRGYFSISPQPFEIPKPRGGCGSSKFSRVRRSTPVLILPTALRFRNRQTCPLCHSGLPVCLHKYGVLLLSTFMGTRHHLPLMTSALGDGTAEIECFHITIIGDIHCFEFFVPPLLVNLLDNLSASFWCILRTTLHHFGRKY